MLSTYPSLSLWNWTWLVAFSDGINKNVRDSTFLFDCSSAVGQEYINEPAITDTRLQFKWVRLSVGPPPSCNFNAWDRINLPFALAKGLKIVYGHWHFAFWKIAMWNQKMIVDTVKTPFAQLLENHWK